MYGSWIYTKVVGLITVYVEVYPIQCYVIKFISDLRQVGGFPRVIRFSSPQKTDRHDITEILLKVALNTINHNHKQTYHVSLLSIGDYFNYYILLERSFMKSFSDNPYSET